MTETIKLQVDRSLIDPKFETYYLANQEVDLQSVDLLNYVSEFTLSDKQLYSYLHFSAFSNDFNYLFTDPFGGQLECYYVDNQFCVSRIEIDSSIHSIKPPVGMFKIPINNFKVSECLVTLSFPSKDIVLILISQCANVDQINGNLSLFIISTGDRRTQFSNWTIVKSINLADESSFGSCWQNDDQLARKLTCPAKIIESNFHSTDHNDKLKVIILTIAKNTDEKFECQLNCLHLCKLQQSAETKELPEWTISRLQQLTGASYPAYIGVDINQDDELFLTIASSSLFRVTFDSCVKPVDCDDQNETGTSLEKENIYFYYQDGPEITVNFKLSSDIERNQIKVNFGLEEMEINVRGERVFKEILWSQIDKESCTWTLEKKSKDENSILEITLAKKDENQTWNQLIKGKEQGSQLSLEESPSFKALNSLISNLSDRIDSTSDYIPSISGNEQCDEVTEDLILYRFNCPQNSITHQAYLAGHQWLFTRKLDNQLLPCFSLRHDVDALVWQPKAQGSKFQVDHEVTFSALGYVQASKQAKKFFNCSPDFDYSFIVDSTNHVYIYKQPARCDGVVNRKAGIRPKIAKQKVINLGHELVQVLGSIAFRDFLLILCPNKVISIKIDF